MNEAQESHAAELYRLGESKLEKAKRCTGSRSTYNDCVELCYYAILYGIKAVLASEDALPGTQEECFEVFRAFHVGTEEFPEELWTRFTDLNILRESISTDKDFLPDVKVVEKMVESSEYTLLLTNMFLIGRGIAI